jgi:hypothetical protein
LSKEERSSIFIANYFISKSTVLAQKWSIVVSMCLEKSSKSTFKFLGDMFTNVHENDHHEIMPWSIDVK